MLITITGASGSGKSSLASYMCSLNKKIVCLNIDEVGHDVLKYSEIKEKIAKKFSLNLVDGNIDRKELGNIVFNNLDKMNELNELTWEAMKKVIDKFIIDNKDKIVILEWILLPLTHYFKISDINILINMDYNIRLKRAMARDNISAEKFAEREKATLDFCQYTYDYIINNKVLADSKKEMEKIYEKSIIHRKF